MTDVERRKAARQFVNNWRGRGKEDEEGRSYWIEFLHGILGVDVPTQHLDFEKKVIVDGNSKRIDVYIPETSVIIEQKSLGVDLSKAQPGHKGLTPYGQAKEYNDNLPHSEKAKWIIVSNFTEIWVYDMDAKVPEPIKYNLVELVDRYDEFDFLVNKQQKKINHEEEISKKAGVYVGQIYRALKAQYIDPTEESEKSLNQLCVRIVFCLYAEDAHVFGNSGTMFHDYIEQYNYKELRGKLIELFKVLDQNPEKGERDKYLDENLAAFPYVNGGLFKDENIEIPQFTEEIRDIILTSSEEFDWSKISPTIFGAVFESTLEAERRHEGGMHYTSVENIHKLIDPLFLDDLNREYENLDKTKKRNLELFQNKLAGLKFLDPACGSGNFLTETFISLRRLENRVIEAIINTDKKQIDGQHKLFFEGMENPIKVSISQFFGIEIDDFAVVVAKTALWIAESQMIKETEQIINAYIDFLPLKTNAYIHEGNSLRDDWDEILNHVSLDYIIGNPPFVGQSVRTKGQSDEMALIWGKGEIETKLDYVICWYKKAIDYMNKANNKMATAFVSTNSICQGESVPTFWKKMVDLNAEIQFAYKSFVWDSEANSKAAVHCNIVGFTNYKTSNNKKIYHDEKNVESAEHINPYIYAAPDIWLENRKNNPQNGLPKMTTGSPPTDDGALTLTKEEKEDLIHKYPILEKYIKPFIGAREFLHDKVGEYSRYCLWFKDGNPADYANIREIRERLERVRNLRLSSNADRIQKMADSPYLFCQIRQPESTYLVFPRHSSQNRRYIPIGFMEPNIIAGDACSIIPNVTLYEFAVLTSNIHNAWMRVVCGRLKSDFRYSPSVYNNFPWPDPTEEQKRKIEETAQGILDARALYPDCSLSVLYDVKTMPIELRQAHDRNNMAVMRAYGFCYKGEDGKNHWFDENDILVSLMVMYQNLTENNQ